MAPSIPKSWATSLKEFRSLHTSRFDTTKASGVLSLGPFTKEFNGPDTTNKLECQRPKLPKPEHAARSICWTVNEYRHRMLLDQDPYEYAEGIGWEEGVGYEMPVEGCELEDWKDRGWWEWKNWIASNCNMSQPVNSDNLHNEDQEMGDGLDWAESNANPSQDGDHEGAPMEVDTPEELDGNENGSGNSNENRLEKNGVSWAGGNPEWILPNLNCRARIGRFYDSRLVLDRQELADQFGRWLHHIAYYV